MSQAQLAQRIQALEESSTLGMTKKARELAAQGHKVISLSVGEPDLKHLLTSVRQLKRQLMMASTDIHL